jgi:1-deoxy-D-xylulose-5-phosphate reductoisomerase
MQNLTFEAPDYERFPALSLATEAVKLGETAPAILNAANEAAVGLFLEEKIRFSQIIPRVAEALRNVPITPARSVEDILTADRAARQFIRESLF